MDAVACDANVAGFGGTCGHPSAFGDGRFRAQSQLGEPAYSPDGSILAVACASHNGEPAHVQAVREIVRASGPALSEGIEHIRVEGVDVPIYGVAKTVADCFKHRRHVGEDVAIEALRDAMRQRRATSSELMHYAAVDRVAARMAPLIKAMQ